MKKLILFIYILTYVLQAGVGDPAPDFTLTKLGGGTVSLGDYNGKVLYIFWFGHGCPYCDDNMRLAELNVTSQYASDIFGAIGIDTWPGSNVSNVAAFQASTANSSLPGGVTFPLLINGESVADDFAVTYDRSMVIDQDGVIRYYGGSHSPHDWTTINNTIQDLLTATDIHREPHSSYSFELGPNYPNPFNPQTSIPFTLNKTQKVKLEVYDIRGKLVKTIINATFAAGAYTASWHAVDYNNTPVSSGVYFLKLSSESNSNIRQIIYIK